MPNRADSEKIVSTDGINNNSAVKTVLHDAVHKLYQRLFTFKMS
jgi:hypothetical protein